jgi:hypothetical protein
VQIKAERRAAHSQRELTTPIGSPSAEDTLSNKVASHLVTSSVLKSTHRLPRQGLRRRRLPFLPGIVSLSAEWLKSAVLKN